MEIKYENQLSMIQKLKNIRHVALDMDGTIYNGSTLFSFTKTFLKFLENRNITYSFLTNNPSQSTEDYICKLDNLGIQATRREMYSTVQATIDYLKTHFPTCRKLFLLGTPSMVSEFVAAGYTNVEINEKPEVVIVSFDKTLAYKRLCKACWWIKNNVPYIATNPDRVCPTDQEEVLVDCGSICAGIEYATGRKPDVVLGKPDPNMLEGIMNNYHLQSNQIMMVGDRIYTDIAMAHNAGVLGVLVLSGETTLDLALHTKPRPDIIADNLADIENMFESFS